MAISDQPPSKAQTGKRETGSKAPTGKVHTGKAQTRRRTAVAVSRRGTATAANGRDRKSGLDHSKHWTFLTNHAHVLILLHGEPELVLREVAARVGITERAVQRIVQDLEEEGFLRRHKIGRRNQYEVLARHSLRHPIESHRKIGDLLKLMEKPH
jgi:hypothetical protein